MQQTVVVIETGLPKSIILLLEQQIFLFKSRVVICTLAIYFMHLIHINITIIMNGFNSVHGPGIFNLILLQKIGLLAITLAFN